MKLIFYCLVGIFYRKDIRRVDYYMYIGTNYSYPVYTYAENNQDAYNRLIRTAAGNITMKDYINLNRIKFANTVQSRYIRSTFLSDEMIGRKPDVIYQKGYYILKFIKKYLMDYSLHVEHIKDEE